MTNRCYLVLIPKFDLDPSYNLKVRTTDFQNILEENTPISFCEMKYYPHFPIILINDNYPWENPLRYFLNKIRSSYKIPSPETLKSIASSLIDFYNFCSNDSVDYLSCEHPLKSPIRKYKSHLIYKIKTESLAVSTVKLRLNHVVNFYRYLIKVEEVAFLHPPFQDSEGIVSIYNNETNQYYHKINLTSDVQRGLGNTGYNNQDSGFKGNIRDYGDLKPLSLNEQSILIKALDELGNIEMKLIFLIALTTGARKETILTLRRADFSFSCEKQKEIIIYAGDWLRRPSNSPREVEVPLPDSKSNKPIKIFFPIPIYNKVKTYINSPRALSRLKKVDSPKKVKSAHYVFLSQQGNPFFISKFDENIFNFQTRPTGQALATFIQDKLKPLLKAMGFESHFKFHDLRATFGMNLTNCLINSTSNEQKVDFSEALNIVKNRMNHSNLSTTQQYLNFKSNSAAIAFAQINYEKYLTDIFENLPK